MSDDADVEGLLSASERPLMIFEDNLTAIHHEAPAVAEA
jgi:hypothetical protein